MCSLLTVLTLLSRQGCDGPADIQALQAEIKELDADKATVTAPLMAHASAAQEGTCQSHKVAKNANLETKKRHEQVTLDISCDDDAPVTDACLPSLLATLQTTRAFSKSAESCHANPFKGEW